jgi:hypothetical protein
LGKIDKIVVNTTPNKSPQTYIYDRYQRTTYIVWMYIQSACRHVETKKAKIIGVITAYMP